MGHVVTYHNGNALRDQVSGDAVAEIEMMWEAGGKGGREGTRL